MLQTKQWKYSICEIVKEVLEAAVQSVHSSEMNLTELITGQTKNSRTKAYATVTKHLTDTTMSGHPQVQ